MAKRKVEGQEVRQIQDVPVGEFIRVRRPSSKCTKMIWDVGCDFTKKTYKNEGYDRIGREYFLGDMDDISRGRWIKKNTWVLVGFTY
jgi:hypothetical protein